MFTVLLALNVAREHNTLKLARVLFLARSKIVWTMIISFV